MTQHKRYPWACPDGRSPVEPDSSKPINQYALLFSQTASHSSDVRAILVYSKESQKGVFQEPAAFRVLPEGAN
jgi:hypothetical protein